MLPFIFGLLLITSPVIIFVAFLAFMFYKSFKNKPKTEEKARYSKFAILSFLFGLYATVFFMETNFNLFQWLFLLLQVIFGVISLIEIKKKKLKGFQLTVFGIFIPIAIIIISIAY